MPSARNCATLRWVAACCPMRTFIARTARTAVGGGRSVVAGLSEMPAAILANRSAVAGAMTTRSAGGWAGYDPSRPRPSRSIGVDGLLEEAAAGVIGVTKCSPPSVSTQRTVIADADQADQFAPPNAIPPPTIRRIRLAVMAGLIARLWPACRDRAAGGIQHRKGL